MKALQRAARLLAHAARAAGACGVRSLTLAAAATLSAATKEKTGSVTYSKDVAPIFNRRCIECHRPREVAPMSLLNYKEVRPWAAAIKEKVNTRTMPPWLADPIYGQFKNDRRMSQAEIDTIVAWVNGGAPEGHRAPHLQIGHARQARRLPREAGPKVSDKAPPGSGPSAPPHHEDTASATGYGHEGRMRRGQPGGRRGLGVADTGTDAGNPAADEIHLA